MDEFMRPEKAVKVGAALGVVRVPGELHVIY